MQNSTSIIDDNFNLEKEAEQKTIIEEIKENGYKKMYLETWKQLESGRKFYEKNGFEQVAVNVHFRKKIKGEVTSK